MSKELFKIKTEIELPVVKKACAICGEFKPLYAVGYHGEETEVCYKCLNLAKKGDVNIS